MNWQETVTDPDEVKVFKALDAPETTWRTVSGVARETGLAPERVLAVISKYDLGLIHRSEVPSVSGQALVGLLEKVGS